MAQHGFVAQLLYEKSMIMNLCSRGSKARRLHSALVCHMLPQVDDRRSARGQWASAAVESNSGSGTGTPRLPLACSTARLCQSTPCIKERAFCMQGPVSWSRGCRG